MLHPLGLDPARQQSDHPGAGRTELVGQLLDQHGQPGPQPVGSGEAGDGRLDRRGQHPGQREVGRRAAPDHCPGDRQPGQEDRVERRLPVLGGGVQHRSGRRAADADQCAVQPSVRGQGPLARRRRRSPVRPDRPAPPPRTPHRPARPPPRPAPQRAGRPGPPGPPRRRVAQPSRGPGRCWPPSPRTPARSSPDPWAPILSGVAPGASRRALRSLRMKTTIPRPRGRRTRTTAPRTRSAAPR